MVWACGTARKNAVHEVCAGFKTNLCTGFPARHHGGDIKVCCDASSEAPEAPPRFCTGAFSSVV